MIHMKFIQNNVIYNTNKHFSQNSITFFLFLFCFCVIENNEKNERKREKKRTFISLKSMKQTTVK